MLCKCKENSPIGEPSGEDRGLVAHSEKYPVIKTGHLINILNNG